MRKYPPPAWTAVARCRGIVTRKDLLGYRLDEALSRAMGNHSHRGSRRADVPSLSLGGARGMPMTRSAGGII
eukprot:355754-Chlamydomonas_euryale.AAC.5